MLLFNANSMNPLSRISLACKNSEFRVLAVIGFAQSCPGNNKATPSTANINDWASFNLPEAPPLGLRSFCPNEYSRLIPTLTAYRHVFRSNLHTELGAVLAFLMNRYDADPKDFSMIFVFDNCVSCISDETLVINFPHSIL
jgi:hypothetical protein